MTDASEILHSFTAEVSEEQNLPHLRQSNITATASEAMRYSSIINYRSLIKVKFSTDQFRRALDHGVVRRLIVTMLKSLKSALFQTFST